MPRSSKISFTNDSSPQFHLHDGPDTELEWFFTMADCAIGVPSNFMALLAGVEPGIDDGYSAESRAEAAHAQRLLRHRLRQLSSHDAGVLQAAYTARPWPLALREHLGRVTGVTVRLVVADQGLPDDDKELEAAELFVARELDTALRAGDRRSLSAWSARGRARFERAFRAYVRARGGSLVPVMRGVIP